MGIKFPNWCPLLPHPQKCKKSFNNTNFKNRVFQRSDPSCKSIGWVVCPYKPSVWKTKIDCYGKVCNADDRGNISSKMTYLGEKVGRSVQKRGEKEQIVVHKKQRVLWEYVLYNIRHLKLFGTKEDTISLKKEPCKVVWFLFSLKNIPTECYSMMCEAYGINVVCRRQIFHWHTPFREGHTSSVAMKQSVKPVSICIDVTINTIRTLITDDSSLTQWWLLQER